MEVKLDLYSFLAIVTALLFIFILLIYLSQKRNLSITKAGIIINGKNHNNILYYISQMLDVVEKKFFINFIEKFEVMMAQTERTIEIYYTDVLDKIKCDFKIKADDMYLYRVVLEKNQLFILNELKKCYKKIDGNIINIWSQYIEHLKVYFSQKICEHLELLLTNENTNNAELVKWMREHFMVKFPLLLEDIKTVYIEYETMNKQFESQINDIIDKIGGLNETK